MLDFKELAPNGNDFELLIRELLFSMGMQVFWSGRGPDGGKDLLCIEEPTSLILSAPRRWLVQCKHNAHAESAVGLSDLDDVVDSCAHHEAAGYLLVCSTYPSSTVVSRLEGITKNPEQRIVATYWDAATIERLLGTPREWPIAQRFFPVSGNTEKGFRIYGTESPNRWVANYRGYFFHLTNRVGSKVRWYLKSVQTRIAEVERIKLPKGHMLRPRAVYYDDKNGGYTWYIDYLHPHKEEPARHPEEIKRILKDGYALDDGQFYSFDIKVYAYNGFSDHYDKDHYQYYTPFFHDFLCGAPRSMPYAIPLPVKAQRASSFLVGDELSNLERDDAFKRLVASLSRLDYIRVIRSVNSSIEHLDKFYFIYDWSEIVEDLDIDPDLFFSARIWFECADFERLALLLKKFPQEVDRHFRVTKVCVFLPDSGYDAETDNLYQLTLSIHPAQATGKLVTRTKLNEYFLALAKVVTRHLGRGSKIRGAPKSLKTPVPKTKSNRSRESSISDVTKVLPKPAAPARPPRSSKPRQGKNRRA